MSIVNIRAAFERKLASITPEYGLDTAYENVPFTPTPGTPYQAVYLLPGAPENPTMGDDHYRSIGVFQVSLFYPLQAGPGDAAAKAEEIKTSFKRGTSLTYGTATVRIKRTPFVGRGRPNGDRWMVPIKIYYFADFQ